MTTWPFTQILVDQRRTTLLCEAQAERMLCHKPNRAPAESRSWPKIVPVLTVLIAALLRPV